MRKKLLLTLVLTLIASLTLAANSLFALADNTYTDAINANFTPSEYVGTWEQSADDTAEGSLLKAKTFGEPNVATGAIISTEFGGLEAADYTLTFDMMIPVADGGQGAGYFYSCADIEDNPYGFNYLNFRNSGAYNFIGGGFTAVAYIEGKAPAAGEWATITVEVEDGTMKVNAKNANGEAFIAELTIDNVVYDESFTQGFVVTDCTATNAADYTGFKNIVYTAGGKTFKAYPFVKADALVPEINDYFTPSKFVGTWEQTADDTAEGSLLKAKTFGEPNVATGAIISTEFGGLEAADYTLTFDMMIPVADGGQGAGYFYSCADIEDNPYGFNYLNFRNSGAFIFIGGNFSAVAYIEGKAPAAGEWATVTVEVEEGTMKVNAKNANGEAFIAEVTIENVVYDESFTQGFVVTDCTATNAADYTGFKNIVYTAGGKTFKAYPFDPAYVAPDAEATFVSTLDNNMLTMSGFGSWEQKSDGSELKALVGNPALGNRAMVFSNFGGEYTENFEITFDTTVPADTTETDNGFFFRAPDLVNGFFSGVLVRVRTNLLQVVYTSEPDEVGNTLQIAAKNYVAGSNINVGDYITVFVKSEEKTITANVIDDEGNSLLDGGAIVVETTCKFEGTRGEGFYAETFAGFYSDKAFPAKFKNVVAIGEGPAENFTAYPFGKNVTDTYKITAPGAVNLAGDESTPDGIALTEENEDVLNKDMNKGYNDVELIGMFTRIFYFHYDGSTQTLKVTKTDGTDIPSSYTMKIYNGADLLAFTDRTHAGRDGLKVVVYDETGYIVFVEDFVVHTLKKFASLTGVTAVDREYDGTRSVDLAGGELGNILEGDSVRIVLGKGMMEDSNIGEDKAVTVNITLEGRRSGDYYILQPEDITVNISKGTQEAPYEPELETVTETTVTLIYDEVFEYSMDGETWQESNVFENLTPDTEYSFYCRIKADSNQNASPASAPLTIKTNAPVNENPSDSGDEPAKSCGGSIGTAGLTSAIILMAAVLFKRKKND